MRGIQGLTAAAILAAAMPAVAQVRGTAPLSRAAAAPARAVSYVRTASPAVPATGSAPRGFTIRYAHPAYSRMPAALSSSSPSSGTVVTTFSNFDGTPIPIGQLLNPAPGQGFDFTHLAAINADLPIRALIDPITQQELDLASRLPRTEPTAFFGGFGDYAAEPLVLQAPPPQVIVIQPPAEPAAPATNALAPPAPYASSAAPPLPGVGQFVLVRSDNTEIHAIAFSREGDSIIYITADGLRHSLPFSELNVEATETRNAERGAILHLE